MNAAKALLRRLFAGTSQRLDSFAATRRAVQQTFGGDRTPKLVLAIGKAAHTMANALRAALPDCPLRGLVVAPGPDAAPCPPFETIGGGHPLPTAASLHAGERALELARSVHADEHAVFLLSGGGSALCELPADANVTLGELQHLHHALIGSGAPIAAINTVRRHLSAVKGGRLAAAAHGARRRVTFCISDVPLDAPPGTIASGPTEAEATTVADCRAVLDRFELWPAVPPALRRRLIGDDLPPLVTAADLAGDERVMVQDAAWPLARAAELARRMQLWPMIDDTTDEWPYAAAAEHLLARLQHLRRRHRGRRVLLLAGGELSVTLPPNPGVGGRNQQFALALAQRIRGLPFAALSAGTDGVDGNSPAAGAVIDGHTCSRAKRSDLDVAHALARCDAFPLFAALGDAVITGPTGTNLRDLRLLLG